MQVTFIPGNEINSDLGVVNAARVSLGKKSHLIEGQLQPQDQKLIAYLATHNHWTPFAHPSLYFSVHWRSYTEALHFYKSYNSAGMAHEAVGGYDDFIKGSVYSWRYNAQFLPKMTRENLYYEFESRYPVSYKALIDDPVNPFSYNSCIVELSEAFIVNRGIWALASATLLVKVPLFIARQIRTSQVGLAYSDLYVEGESFAFNEVSRRYVNDEPEYYHIEQWRVREGKSVKQGSTGLVDSISNTAYNGIQRCKAVQELDLYKEMIMCSVAPEQARALLSQRMYTEFYMTGTLRRWAQFISLRLQPDVQEETRVAAELIRDALKKQHPKWAEAYQL